jgi:DNA-binding transcriptional MerR regulator/methylmalonyl-CoA mutase cobalamin-binding subunit
MANSIRNKTVLSRTNCVTIEKNLEHNGSKMPSTEAIYPIGIVERDTGIARDTLRVWERRYGFPEPSRNNKGERTYSESQLRQLQRVRRLLDQGLRPGKLLRLSATDLDQLEARLQSPEGVQRDAEITDLLDAVCAMDVSTTRALLQRRYQQQGMEPFVNKTIVPLLACVGEMWAGGQLQIYQEHFLSQQLVQFLNTEFTRLQRTARKPVVLLATLPNEEHTLGLLMLAAILSSRGITAINLGAEVPMDQIAQAVEQLRADIVGVTFSGAYQYSSIRRHLVELREQVSDDIDIWVGGEGVRRLRKLPDGIVKFTSLTDIPL